MYKMNKSSYSKKLQDYEMSLSRLKDIKKLSHLPKELQTQVQNLITVFEKYDMNQHKDKSVELTGNILTEDEVKEIVVDASGYTKWTVEKQEEDQDHECLKDTYGVEFDDSKAVTYLVSRQVRSRDDLWLISFTCLPGHVYLGFDTGRVGYGIEKILKNTQAMSNIAAQFD